MVTQSMRPQCKADTYYVPMFDGVYLRGNNSRLTLKGKSLSALLEHLVPYLDGNVTLEELTEGLDADRKRMITDLIEKLFAHEFLKDRNQDQPHTLRPLELETYASNIAFIESFQPSAASRFEYFRNKHLLIIGSGLRFPSLVQASLQCGVKQIDVMVTLEGEAGSPFLPDTPGLFVKYDAEQTVRLRDTPLWESESEVRKAIQRYDAILHLAERPMLARAQLLNRLCVDEQKTFIQAILMDDDAWIGPLVCPEMRGCWECAWRRLQVNQMDRSDHLSCYALRDQPLVSHHTPLTRVEATVIANRLLLALFQHFTQTSFTETAGKVSRIDLETCQSESHAFLPHPDCLACQHPPVPTASQFLEQIRQLQHQAPLDPDIFLENVAGCVDKRCGLFTALDSAHFVQVPLAVYKVNLANPLLRKGQPASLDAVAVSIDTRDARMRALQKACERYAANVVHQRRLLSPESVPHHSFPVLAADQLVGVTPLSAEREMWTWALDLQTQQAALIPATHVSSALCMQERGIASGKTWDEAIYQALLDWCNYLTVEQVKDARQPYLQVDLDKMPLTPEGGHLYRLLQATGERLTVYDVTGPLRVPTFAACLNGSVVTYSTHCDTVQALRVGFEQTLQHYQSERFQQVDYALAPVPDCPTHLRSDQSCLPRYTVPDAWPARLEWLLQQLQASDFHAFAIPLNDDAALARVLPFIVRVLLRRRELERGE